MEVTFARRDRRRWLVGVLAAAAVALGTAVPAAAATSGWGPDPTFATNLGTGFNSAVTPVVRQADGRLLVGGNFTSAHQRPRAFSGRSSPASMESTAAVVLDPAVADTRRGRYPLLLCQGQRGWTWCGGGRVVK
jgi:hypothetical protein